jgi:hypothetical protein
VKPTLFQGESSIIETNPFRNNALTYVKSSGCEVVWQHFMKAMSPDMAGFGFEV